MDMWNVPAEKLRMAAARKYPGREVARVWVSSGLWANVDLADGGIGEVYSRDLDRLLEPGFYGTANDSEVGVEVYADRGGEAP